MKPYRFLSLSITILLGVWLAPLRPSALPDSDQDPAFAYHLRVVRVSGADAAPGAALGWADDGGKPVVLPALEAWGSHEQLESIAAALGGDRADAVTGFFLTAGDKGVPDFRRPVFIGEAVLELEFRAEIPFSSDGGHRIGLTLVALKPEQATLTEAELLLRTDQTVAIACPSVSDEEWLVIAVTPIAQHAVLEQSTKIGEIYDLGDPGLEHPRLLEKVEPVYPKAALRTGVSGHVVLHAVLDPGGFPRAATVMDMSPGCEELAAAAVEALLQWRYEPARLDGQPVSVSYTATVRFSLR